MEGYCNMCGKCCEAIRLNVSSEEIRDVAERERRNGHDTSDAIFINEHWKEIEHAEAFKINPVFQLQAEAGMIDDKQHFYKCDMYDAATRRCMAHDSRPRVCSGYPYYGRPNESEYFTWYSPLCGYISGMWPGERALMIALVEELEKRQVSANGVVEASTGK